MHTSGGSGKGGSNLLTTIGNCRLSGISGCSLTHSVSRSHRNRIRLDDIVRQLPVVVSRCISFATRPITRATSPQTPTVHPCESAGSEILD